MSISVFSCLNTHLFRIILKLLNYNKEDTKNDWILHVSSNCHFSFYNTIVTLCILTIFLHIFFLPRYMQIGNIDISLSKKLYQNCLCFKFNANPSRINATWYRLQDQQAHYSPFLLTTCFHFLSQTRGKIICLTISLVVLTHGPVWSFWIIQHLVAST